SANRGLLELKRQVQAGEPRSVIGRTVEKIEDLLGATGANLMYAGYPSPRTHGCFAGAVGARSAQACAPAVDSVIQQCRLNVRVTPASGPPHLITLGLRRAKSGPSRCNNIDRFPQGKSCDQFIHSADDSHGQRFHASPHVYFAHRKSTHFDAGSGSDDVGHNELTTIIFGQVLETSSHMYRIADCCQEKAIPVAKLAQDRVAGVEADADCNWLRQFVSQCSIHVGETAMNKLRRN